VQEAPELVSTIDPTEFHERPFQVGRIGSGLSVVRITWLWIYIIQSDTVYAQNGRERSEARKDRAGPFQNRELFR
jgi:hypothetical protein